eukprot:COSAG01_NODE_19466_length_1008_cov_0.946095_1_plen_238_part_10
MVLLLYAVGLVNIMSPTFLSLARPATVLAGAALVVLVRKVGHDLSGIHAGQVNPRWVEMDVSSAMQLPTVWLLVANMIFSQFLRKLGLPNAVACLLRFPCACWNEAMTSMCGSQHDDVCRLGKHTARSILCCLLIVALIFLFIYGPAKGWGDVGSIACGASFLALALFGMAAVRITHLNNRRLQKSRLSSGLVVTRSATQRTEQARLQQCYDGNATASSSDPPPPQMRNREQRAQTLE